MARTHGLTLGKFAPLHRGHQLVIETALAETERVSVIIYDCPETTDVPLPVRARWISRLYPGIEIIEAPDGPTEVGSDPRIERLHEDYVLRTLGVSGITHFYSSEFYGDHMSRALGAVNRLVDPQRELVPICGTQIRREPFRHRRYLDPLVYRDLVTNVVSAAHPAPARPRSRHGRRSCTTRSGCPSTGASTGCGIKSSAAGIWLYSVKEVRLVALLYVLLLALALRGLVLWTGARSTRRALPS